MLGINHLIIICCLTVYGAYTSENREIIRGKDRPYDIINIRIPENIFRQAFNPTPVSKAGATVTLPIYVPQDDEENDAIEEVTEVQIVQDETIMTNSTVEPDPSLQPIQQVEPVQPVPPVEDTQQTEAPVQQDEVQPVSDAPGGGSGTTGQVTRLPCTCTGRVCKCCTGALLDRINMKACSRVEFVPEDFIFDVRLILNGNTVVRRRVSASNPPPICFNPGRAPFINLCLEISNIRMQNRNLFACLDINAEIATFPIYSASFRCFGFGFSGLQIGLRPKPVSSGPRPVNLFGNSNNDDDDSGGFIGNAASAILGGGRPRPGNGFFGGGLFGVINDGTLDDMGDAVGGVLGGNRK